LFGLPSFIGLSRDKRNSKEILIPKWIEDNKTFFDKRQIKITGKHSFDLFVCCGRIDSVSANPETNTCRFSVKCIVCIPSESQIEKWDGVLEKEPKETFNLEDVELLLY
jgi:hypothetical protein